MTLYIIITIFIVIDSLVFTIINIIKPAKFTKHDGKQASTQGAINDNNIPLRCHLAEEIQINVPLNTTYIEN